MTALAFFPSTGVATLVFSFSVILLALVSGTVDSFRAADERLQCPLGYSPLLSAITWAEPWLAPVWPPTPSGPTFVPIVRSSQDPSVHAVTSACTAPVLHLDCHRSATLFQVTAEEVTANHSVGSSVAIIVCRTNPNNSSAGATGVSSAAGEHLFTNCTTLASPDAVLLWLLEQAVEVLAQMRTMEGLPLNYPPDKGNGNVRRDISVNVVASGYAVLTWVDDMSTIVNRRVVPNWQRGSASLHPVLVRDAIARVVEASFRFFHVLAKNTTDVLDLNNMQWNSSIGSVVVLPDTPTLQALAELRVASSTVVPLRFAGSWNASLTRFPRSSVAPPKVASLAKTQNTSADTIATLVGEDVVFSVVEQPEGTRNDSRINTSMPHYVRIPANGDASSTKGTTLILPLPSNVLLSNPDGIEVYTATHWTEVPLAAPAAGGSGDSNTRVVRQYWRQGMVMLELDTTVSTSVVVVEAATTDCYVVLTDVACHTSTAAAAMVLAPLRRAVASRYQASLSLTFVRREAADLGGFRRIEVQTSPIMCTAQPSALDVLFPSACAAAASASGGLEVGTVESAPWRVSCWFDTQAWNATFTTTTTIIFAASTNSDNVTVTIDDSVLSNATWQATWGNPSAGSGSESSSGGGNTWNSVRISAPSELWRTANKAAGPGSNTTTMWAAWESCDLYGGGMNVTWLAELNELASSVRWVPWVSVPTAVAVPISSNRTDVESPSSAVTISSPSSTIPLTVSILGAFAGASFLGALVLWWCFRKEVVAVALATVGVGLSVSCLMVLGVGLDALQQSPYDTVVLVEVFTSQEACHDKDGMFSRPLLVLTIDAAVVNATALVNVASNGLAFAREWFGRVDDAAHIPRWVRPVVVGDPGGALPGEALPLAAALCLVDEAETSTAYFSLHSRVAAGEVECEATSPPPSLLSSILCSLSADSRSGGTRTIEAIPGSCYPPDPADGSRDLMWVDPKTNATTSASGRGLVFKATCVRSTPSGNAQTSYSAAATVDPATSAQTPRFDDAWSYFVRFQQAYNPWYDVQRREAVRPLSTFPVSYFNDTTLLTTDASSPSGDALLGPPLRNESSVRVHAMTPFLVCGEDISSGECATGMASLTTTTIAAATLSSTVPPLHCLPINSNSSSSVVVTTPGVLAAMWGNITTTTAVSSSSSASATFRGPPCGAQLLTAPRNTVLLGVPPSAVDVIVNSTAADGSTSSSSLFSFLDGALRYFGVLATLWNPAVGSYGAGSISSSRSAGVTVHFQVRILVDSSGQTGATTTPPVSGLVVAVTDAALSRGGTVNARLGTYHNQSSLLGVFPSVSAVDALAPVWAERHRRADALGLLDSPTEDSLLIRGSALSSKIGRYRPRPQSLFKRALRRTAAPESFHIAEPLVSCYWHVAVRAIPRSTYLEVGFDLSAQRSRSDAASGRNGVEESGSSPEATLHWTFALPAITTSSATTTTTTAAKRLNANLVRAESGFPTVVLDPSSSTSSSTTRLADSEWHSVAMVCAERNGYVQCQLYIDGETSTLENGWMRCTAPSDWVMHDLPPQLDGDVAAALAQRISASIRQGRTGFDPGEALGAFGEAITGHSLAPTMEVRRVVVAPRQLSRSELKAAMGLPSISSHDAQVALGLAVVGFILSGLSFTYAVLDLTGSWWADRRARAAEARRLKRMQFEDLTGVESSKLHNNSNNNGDGGDDVGGGAAAAATLLSTGKLETAPAMRIRRRLRDALEADARRRHVGAQLSAVRQSAMQGAASVETTATATAATSSSAATAASSHVAANVSVLLRYVVSSVLYVAQMLSVYFSNWTWPAVLTEWASTVVSWLTLGWDVDLAPVHDYVLPGLAVVLTCFVGMMLKAVLRFDDEQFRDMVLGLLAPTASKPGTATSGQSASSAAPNAATADAAHLGEKTQSAANGNAPQRSSAPEALAHQPNVSPDVASSAGSALQAPAATHAPSPSLTFIHDDTSSPQSSDAPLPSSSNTALPPISANFQTRLQWVAHQQQNCIFRQQQLVSLGAAKEGADAMLQLELKNCLRQSSDLLQQAEALMSAAREDQQRRFFLHQQQQQQQEQQQQLARHEGDNLAESEGGDASSHRPLDVAEVIVLDTTAHLLPRLSAAAIASHGELQQQRTAAMDEAADSVEASPAATHAGEHCATIAVDPSAPAAVQADAHQRPLWRIYLHDVTSGVRTWLPDDSPLVLNTLARAIRRCNPGAALPEVADCEATVQGVRSTVVFSALFVKGGGGGSGGGGGGGSGSMGLSHAANGSSGDGDHGVLMTVRRALRNRHSSDDAVFVECYVTPHSLSDGDALRGFAHLTLAGGGTRCPVHDRVLVMALDAHKRQANYYQPQNPSIPPALRPATSPTTTTVTTSPNTTAASSSPPSLQCLYDCEVGRCFRRIRGLPACLQRLRFRVPGEYECFLCPVDGCSVAVCDTCYNGTLFDVGVSLSAGVLDALRRMGAVQVIGFAVLLLTQLLLAPVIQTCSLLLLCHVRYQCRFPGCYTAPSASFLVMATLAACTVGVVGFGLTGFLALTLVMRKRLILSALDIQTEGADAPLQNVEGDEEERTATTTHRPHQQQQSGGGGQWEDSSVVIRCRAMIVTLWYSLAQHPLHLPLPDDDWRALLDRDGSLIRSLYEPYRFQFLWYHPIWMTLRALAVLPAVYGEANSLTQLGGSWAVEVAFLVVVVALPMYSDRWVTLTARTSCIHQTLQLSLSLAFQSLELESRWRHVVASAMLWVFVAYLSIVVLILVAAVLAPILVGKWREARGAQHNQNPRARVYLDTDDGGQEIELQ